MFSRVASDAPTLSPILISFTSFYNNTMYNPTQNNLQLKLSTKQMREVMLYIHLLFWIPKYTTRLVQMQLSILHIILTTLRLNSNWKYLVSSTHHTVFLCSILELPQSRISFTLFSNLPCGNHKDNVPVKLTHASLLVIPQLGAF